MLKPEVRVIAWDDCAFSFKQKKVLVVGPIFRGGVALDGMLSVHVKKDGDDATEMIADAILNSRHHDQLSYIMLNGITVAGFNVIDIQELNERTKLPVIAIQRRRPDIKEFLRAIGNVKNCKNKIANSKKAGKFFTFWEIFYQKAGLKISVCNELLKLTCVRSNVPEPLRVAHLIASGLGGESRGRA